MNTPFSHLLISDRSVQGHTTSLVYVKMARYVLIEGERDFLTLEKKYIISIDDSKQMYPN